MTKNYNLFNWIFYFRKSLMTLILVALSVFSGMSQTTSVKTGKVIDETGLPLPGVSVKIKNAAGGTMTDGDGKFSLNTDDKAILVFSYLGYDTQEVSAAGKGPFQVSLKPNQNLMDEVVVVGYVTKNKSQIVSSVSTVSADKLLDVTSNSTSAMLQGKASGVNVSSVSGQPGAGTSIRVRGTGTISSGSEPLMVVDGVIGGSANPRDIESVTVLKDAAATGLYGSRAANGVLVITTKQGNAGKTKIDYSGSFGVNNASEGNFKVMNGQQLRDYSAYMYTNDYTGKRSAYIKELQGTIPNPTEQQINDYLTSKDLATTLPGYLNGFMPESPLNTSWRDLAFRQGYTNNQALSISGGDEKTKFYIGTNYYDEQGTLVNTDYKSFNFRTNLEHKINDRFKVTARLNAGFTKTNNDPSGALGQSYTNSPWNNPFNADGSPRYVDANTPNWYGRDKSNFLFVSQYNRDNSRGQNLAADVKLEYKITDWLNFATSNRYTVTNSRAEKLIDARTPAGKTNGGELYNAYGYTNSFITSNLFNAAHSFGKHNLSGIAGFEYQKNYSDGLIGTGTGIFPELGAMDATAVMKSLAGARSMSKFVSQLFMGDYNYDNRYFATVSLRNDASSKFGPNKRSGLFYSIGAGWNIANESFFKSEILNTLKLRGSYGVTGNTPPGDYAHLDLYMADVQYGGIPGAFPRSLPNPNLTWETPTTINAGVDIGLFNRIDLSIDAYQRTNKDLILDRPLASETGFYYSTENIGSVRNRGIDIELNTRNLTGEFKWSTSFNVGINRNKVMILHKDEDIDRGYQRVSVGRDLNSWYMQEWAGVDQNNGKPLWYTTKTDANGAEYTTTTSIQEDADLRYVGTSTPDFIGGLGNEFSYKNFSLNAFINFVSGSMVYNSDRELFDADGAYPQYNSMVLKKGWSRWEKPGDVATHPQAVANGNNNSNKPSSRYLEDGSYIRLRNVTLGYTLSDKVTEKLKLSNVRFFVSGDNLITLTRFSGMDPEVPLTTEGNNSVGVVGTKYPISKKVLFGVNVSF